MATPHTKRPHPAKRARAITGAISVASVLGLTGYMASAAHTATVTASGTTTNTVTTSESTATTVTSSADSGLAAAIPSTPSSSTTTSSHTS